MKEMLKKASFFGAALLMLALSASTASAATGNQKWPYLIYPGVNTQMMVLWQDYDTETTNVLSWGTDTSYSLGSVTVAELPATVTIPGVGTVTETYPHQHKYTITGLKPNTKYYYKVADATNGVYGTGSFITAPDVNATSVKFIAQGDSRSQPWFLDALDKEITKFTNLPGNAEYQRLSVANGDWVSTDGESYWTNEWFDKTKTDLVYYTANTPIDGVKGNHDNTSGYSATLAKYFPFPYPNATIRSGSKDASNNPYYNNLYWSMDYGPVHFTFIDEYSDMSVGGTQYNWVQSDLSSTTKPWKIVIYHAPAYSAGSDADNTAVRVFEPMFTTYGVDLVFCGHSHNYARTGAYNSLQANGDQIALNMPHITSGGGGAPIYQTRMDQGGGYPHVIVAWASLEFLAFDVEGDTMTYTAYQVNNASTSSAPPANTSITPIETLILHHMTNISSSLQITPSVTPGAAIPCTGTGTAMQCTAMVTIKNTTASPITGSLNLVLDGMLYLQGLNIPATSTTGIPTGLSNQYVTAGVTASGGTKLTSPIALTTGLITDVTLLNSVSSNNGEPMMKGNTTKLNPGASTIYPLVFQNPNGRTLTFCANGQLPYWKSSPSTTVNCINPVVFKQ